jgi:sugar phosphate isomerase/epimerase
MKIAFSTLACPNWSWEQIIDNAARLGYHGIELRGVEGEMVLPKARPFLPEAIEQTMADLKERGLDICSLDTSCSFHAESKFAASLKEGSDTIELAQKLGVPYVRVFGDRIPPSEERDTVLDRIARGLDELGRLAEGTGVTVLLETHGDIHHSELVLDIFSRIKSQSVGLLWDFEHPFMAGEAPAVTYERLRHLIKHVHVKDAYRNGEEKVCCAVGEGIVPVLEMIRLLQNDGYEGWYSLEYEKKWKDYLEEPEISLPAFINYLKSHSLI